MCWLRFQVSAYLSMNLCSYELSTGMEVLNEKIFMTIHSMLYYLMIYEVSNWPFQKRKCGLSMVVHVSKCSYNNFAQVFKIRYICSWFEMQVLHLAPLCGAPTIKHSKHRCINENILLLMLCLTMSGVSKWSTGKDNY